MTGKRSQAFEAHFYDTQGRKLDLAASESNAPFFMSQMCFWCVSTTSGKRRPFKNCSQSEGEGKKKKEKKMKKKKNYSFHREFTWKHIKPFSRSDSVLDARCNESCGKRMKTGAHDHS